jgi:hypothetical protein
MYQRRRQALRGHSYRRLRFERGMECFSMYPLNACSVSLTEHSQIINTGNNARERDGPVGERRQDDGFHRRTRRIVRATTTGEPSPGNIEGFSNYPYSRRRNESHTPAVFKQPTKKQTTTRIPELWIRP